MKLKWLTSLVILLALTGPVWAGVCGCFAEQKKGHSCCKKEKSSGDYMAGKTCCSADCEKVAGSFGKLPQNHNHDGSHLKAPSKAVQDRVQFAVVWLPDSLRHTPRAKARTGDHRLRLARGPDLYLRHNSFLI